MTRKCSRSWELFAALAALFVGVDGQLGPSDGLCQRFGHQSTILGDKLILAGGFRVVQDPKSGVVRELPTNDFQSLDLGPQGTRFSLDKPRASGGPPWQSINYTVDGAAGLPKVVNGAMFRDGDDLYIYEGRLPGLGPEASSSLWKYTNATSTWGQDITWTHADPTLPNRVSRGASVTMGDRGVGVYLGGARIFINDSATPVNGNWLYPSEEQLTTFDLRTKNRTTTGLPDAQKRAGAALAFLPIGTEGAIIGIGGTLENDKVRSTGSSADITRESFDSDDLNFSPMQRVWIMDLATRQWYSQSTFGQYFPDERMEHCIAVASAPDNSSHNIYMFGGSSGSSFLNRKADKYYNELYILSIPSFRWIRRVFEASDNAPEGRVQHTCHVYGKNLIVLGGATLNTTDKCTWDELSILDMTTLNWVTDYRYSSGAYAVPNLVMGSISNNGVVQSDPVNGWDDHDLQALFATAGISSHSGGVSMVTIAAVAGGIAGGIILLLIIAAGVTHYRKRARNKRGQRILRAKTAYESSRYGQSYPDQSYTGHDPSRDGGAMELHSSPSSASSNTFDHGTGYAHPGKLWRSSYYSIEDTEVEEREERVDDEAGLIAHKVPPGYFELGAPHSPTRRAHELSGGGDLSEGRIHEPWEATSPISSRHSTWR
ncbi:hypothetical protein Dda_5313 [Drechslerella dactyloides]|uniref:Kelch repeat protein n=1 Tax=Drechslerella dactyloides TaxID=74499 RepID=A0AAD6NIP7_DREDA|nr:hypothetical protein Dda_5313 [Drechslerella dactyloides]